MWRGGCRGDGEGLEGAASPHPVQKVLSAPDLKLEHPDKPGMLRKEIISAFEMTPDWTHCQRSGMQTRLIP